MAELRKILNSGFSVKPHYDLTRVTEDELRSDPQRVVSDADQGIQTAIIGPDGKTVRSIVGLNCTRYLPDPDPDPLDEILQVLMDSEGKKK